MATSTAQRVGIWVIAVAMIVGTIAGFVAMILSSENSTQSQAVLQEYQAAYSKYQQETAAQDTELADRTESLSKQYQSQFLAQKNRVAKFKADVVKKLTVDTIVSGKGEVIGDDTTYAAYYIGFTPDGKIFDSSLEKMSLKTPLIIRPNGVISGWSEGMKGKKIGGIYKLTIPSDKAYGEQGSGEAIEPNTPLIFIVMPIEILETLSEPEMTPEVLEAYGLNQ